MTKKNIVWLASYPKSGNTWLKSAIYLALTGKLDINDFASLIPRFNACETLHRGFDSNELEEHTKRWTAAQVKISETTSKNVLLKTHNIAGEVNGVPFPSAANTLKAIYVVRDPRDIALSYASHFGESISETISGMLNDRNTISDYNHTEFISSWRIHVISWTNTTFPTLVIKYENLLDDPLTEFARLFTFLKIRPKVTLDELITATSFKNLSLQEKKRGFSEAVNGKSFFRRGKQGGWKLDKSTDFSLLEAGFSKEMKALGYMS